jgi:predicted ATPase
LAQAWAALALWLLGYPDQARQRSREAISLARELAHPYSLSYALHWAATVQQFCREPHTARELSETVLALAHEQGFALFVALGTILQGWAPSAQSQGLEGMTQIRAGIAAWRAAGSRAWQPYFLGLLAEAYGDGGHPEEGLQALAEALAIIDSSGERLYAAELYRLKGVLLQQLAAPQEEAEACFRQALDVARHQEAKSLELRAAMSLGRLWQQQGKCTEARELLTPIYGWFTEGFDTADLQEAKALLDALR